MEADMVNHPPHYNMGKIEVLDFILDQKMSYLQGQVIKYLCRYKHKGNPKQDLEKARFYLDRLIQEVGDDVVLKTSIDEGSKFAWL